MGSGVDFADDTAAFLAREDRPSVAEFGRMRVLIAGGGEVGTLIGPGLGLVGPTEHDGHLPHLAQWVLSFCMIAGRLEFSTMLVIFAPTFWRR